MPRLALIGCGNIAEFHPAAFRAAGFHLAAVCSRPGSPRLHSFAQRHDIPLVFDHVSDLFAAREHWDAVLIAVSVDATLNILLQALELDVPVLVEKPIAWRSNDLLPLVNRQLSVIVGYNRRFYRTVQEAQKEVLNGPPLLGHLALPEAVRTPGQPSDDLAYLKPFFGNSVHGLDIARYVFGGLRLVDVQRLTNSDGAIQALMAMLTTDRGDILHFTGNWQAPANFSLTLDRPGRRFEMRPFEAATIYEGMEVTPPTAEEPIRTYKPKQVGKVDLDETDYRCKPGFVGQARALAALIRGEDPGPAARLEDAHADLELAEGLVGQALPKEISGHSAVAAGGEPPRQATRA